MSNNTFNHIMDIVKIYSDMAKDARRSGNKSRADEYQSLIDELLRKYNIQHAIKVA